MQQRLSSVLGRRPQRRDGDKESITLAEWSPLVDITEDDKEYLIKAELPEIKKEEIEVTLDGEALWSNFEPISAVILSALFLLLKFAFAGDDEHAVQFRPVA